MGFFMRENLFIIILLCLANVGLFSLRSCGVVDHLMPKDPLNVASVGDTAFYNFSVLLEERLNVADAAFFNQHFDLDSIVQQIVDQTPAPDSFSTAFVSGVHERLNVGDQVSKSLGIGGVYKLLNVDTGATQSEKVAIFRLVNEDGLNYHMVNLYATPKGNIRIADIYILMGGMTFSNTLKRIYLTDLAAVLDSSEVSKLPLAEQAFITHIPEIDEVGKWLSKKKFKRALRTIDKLPPILQEDKMVLIMRMNVAFNSKKAAYKKAIQDFKKMYPKDPVVDLMMLDLSFLKQDHKNTLSIIDSIDQKIGGDAYLDVIRGDVYKAMAKSDSAEVKLRRSIAQELDQEEAYWSLLKILQNQERYADMVAIFPQMDSVFRENPATFLVEKIDDAFWTDSTYLAWAVENPLPDSLRLKLAASHYSPIELPAPHPVPVPVPEPSPAPRP